MMGCLPRVALGASYTLNEIEQLAVQEAAEGRHRACRSASVPNGRRNPAGDLATDLEGLAGEFAFCRLFNVYPDFVIGVRPPFDATLPGGWRVDVKTTSHEHGCLLVLPGHLTADVYALMIGTFPGSYSFRGFALRADVEAAPIEDPGYGAAHRLRQAELVVFDRTWRRTVAV